MWMRWLPWRWILRRAARAHGFLDPVALLARLRQFAQPSEVAEPIELLRAGTVLHARGLINGRVFQHNLDWAWPMWVRRQFDPRDDAFLPRGFAFSQINLTHRNWTAVGLPDLDATPLVDPAGLVTPHHDGWSLDVWVMGADGSVVLPARRSPSQRLSTGNGLSVETTLDAEGKQLSQSVSVVCGGQQAACRLRARLRAGRGDSLVVSLRPVNPEGISFIESVSLAADGEGWIVNGEGGPRFSRRPDRHHASDYHGGDVLAQLPGEPRTGSRCRVGLATAAAVFDVDGDGEVEIHVPLRAALPAGAGDAASRWRDALSASPTCRLRDRRAARLFDEAVRSLVLLTPGDPYPGPYTYRRFWFRDAAFMVHALLCAGQTARARRAIDRFPSRQTRLGYFHSQSGEWDSNGQVLWIMRRFAELTGEPLDGQWWRAVRRGARWITRKRLPDDGGSPHAGLLPAGFSAEHLGPNDYYYWDDFWSRAGLEAAAALAGERGEHDLAGQWRAEARSLESCLARSLGAARERLGREAMPASPYRRLDSGAVGSLAAGYPLQLLAPDDPGLADTCAFLLEKCLVHGGLFQAMEHSGINPYLTLHLAQVLMRAGDPRAGELMERVAELASPTGQWPEAIHPRTGGGCMGDGQHTWAAAEWVLAVRNAFVREEGDDLVLGQGVGPGWYGAGEAATFGHAPTRFGEVLVEVAQEPSSGGVRVSWDARWRRAPGVVAVRVPGFEPRDCSPGQAAVTCPPLADEAERRTCAS